MHPDLGWALLPPPQLMISAPTSGGSESQGLLTTTRSTISTSFTNTTVSRPVVLWPHSGGRVGSAVLGQWGWPCFRFGQLSGLGPDLALDVLRSHLGAQPTWASGMGPFYRFGERSGSGSKLSLVASPALTRMHLLRRSCSGTNRFAEARQRRTEASCTGPRTNAARACLRCRSVRGLGLLPAVQVGFGPTVPENPDVAGALMSWDITLQASAAASRTP